MEELHGTAVSSPQAAQFAIDLGTDPGRSGPPVAREAATAGYTLGHEEIVSAVLLTICGNS
jgi:hypothetical protein